MNDEDRAGIELLHRTIDEVAAALPAPPPAPSLAVSAPVSYLPGFLRTRPGLLRPALAAGLVFAVMAYPAYLGLFRLPSTGPVELRLVSLPRQPEAERGPTDLPEPVTVAIAEGGSAVLLVELVPEWLEGGSGGARTEELVFRIQTAATGAIVEAWSLSGPRLRQLLEISDGVPLLVHGLAAGRYVLRLTRQRESGYEELSSIPLEVVP